MKLKNGIYLLFIFIFTFQFCGFAFENLNTPSDSAAYQKNPNYIQQMALYKIYKMKKANIVMLGNSITHGVDWPQLLGRNDVVGEGITSDVLEGYLSRVYYVTRLHPKVCFIMGGINDIYNWHPLQFVFQEYVELIKELQSKNIKVVIQSTLYVAPKYPSAADRNKQVTKLDSMLKEYADKNHIDYIDLNKEMSSGGFLYPDLTHDGVHPNANGYLIWRKAVEYELHKLGL